LVALTASAIVTNFELLSTEPALHFSAIALAVGDLHSKRLQIPDHIRDRLIENIWLAALQYAPSLSDHFMAFAGLSARAMKIWRDGEGNAPRIYFERHFSKTVADVPIEEFMRLYEEFTGAFEQRLDREEKNWRSGK
jgi:hypothetical protein